MNDSDLLDKLEDYIEEESYWIEDARVIDYSTIMFFIKQERM